MTQNERTLLVFMSTIATLVVALVGVSLVLALMNSASPPLEPVIKPKPAEQFVYIDAAHKVLGIPHISKRERRINKSLGRLPVIHTRYERRVKPSTYLGKWYRPKAERNRRCIVWRESNAILHVRNGGLYQFEQPTSDHVARLIHRPDLVGTSATYWTRKEQDKGFWRLWQGRKGAFHWQGGNWDCLQKVGLS